MDKSIIWVILAIIAAGLLGFRVGTVYKPSFHEYRTTEGNLCVATKDSVTCRWG